MNKNKNKIKAFLPALVLLEVSDWLDVPRVNLEGHKEILIGIIITFLSLSIIAFIIAFIARTKNLNRSKKERKLKQRYEKILASILFVEDEFSKEKAFAYFSKNDLNDKFNRQVLLEEILQLHKNLTGKEADKLKQLYLWMGFKEESYDKMKSSRWNVKVKGIQELEQMKVTEAYKNILDFVNDDNTVLRVEAQIALAKLIDFDALSFLDHTKYPLTEWEQVNLFYVFSNLQKDHVPDFTQWLEAKKDSIKIFAIKMIGYFNQEQAIDKLLILLHHENPNVRKAVVNTLIHLNSFYSINALKEQYEKDDDLEVKMAILKAIGALGTGEEISFLADELNRQQQKEKEEADNEENRVKRMYSTYNPGVYRHNALKIAAAEAMTEIESGENELNRMLSDGASEENKKIIKHALSKHKHTKKYNYV